MRRPLPEYIYAEDKNDILKEHKDLKGLPQQMIRDILSSVEDGDVAKLKESINNLEGVDKDAADELRVLAENYDYEKIQNLLKELI
jgi:hypothetical protein